MKSPGENDNWTPARLRARLHALKGLAPAPSCYVVWRSTRRANTLEIRGYELPDEPDRRGGPEFERWLAERGLAGAERLSVSVLVIREQLDAAGLVREGVLERRRGDVEGPYHGNVARVEFTGAARTVRGYRATRDGRLTELPELDDAGTASAGGATPLGSEPDVEGFAGEDDAVHAYFGAGVVILDRRAPSLFEDFLGLSTIIHVRRDDGSEIGCGVGWHGGTAFVIAADFPRQNAEPVAPPDLEAAVMEAIRSRDLIRHETRHDEQGFRVIARVRGQHSLVAIHPEGGATRIDPYLPGRVASATDDQRRWMAYTETYEARVVLDSWRNGPGDEIFVVTIDPDQEGWRHLIDADGIEISRRSDNGAAAVVLYRERVNPPDPQMTPLTDPAPAGPSGPAGALPTDDTLPPDSLLTRLIAWTQANALLFPSGDNTGSDAATVPPEALDRLRELIEPLNVLDTRFSVGLLNRLLTRARSGAMTMGEFGAALRQLAGRFRDELALTRVVVLPAVQRSDEDEPPFGPLVEAHFPAAAYDIEEAVHCLLLRRSTACVLHAMTVMRHGLLGVEGLLSVSALTDLSWPRLIAKVRDKEGDPHPLADALARVRRTWQAPGLLPAAKYTEEEAEAVLAAVASFMRTLAAMLEARGETRAD